ncbi:MAG: hypothetical protein ACTSUE_13450 [Promethearchaeota archaeon]
MMGFFYYNRVNGNTEENVHDQETVDKIIKYNVLPTMTYGTIIFCATMFIVNFTAQVFIFTIGGILFSFIGYLVFSILTFFFAMKGRNSKALFYFYGLCFFTGMVQAPILTFGMAILGDFEDLLVIFSIAVLSATATLFTLHVFTRYSSTFFKEGRGFVKLTWIILTFLSIGFSIWIFSSLLIGDFSWYLLASSMFAVFVTGIWTIIDLASLRNRVASGRWVYATAHLSVDYFILIIRIFLIMVLGGGSKD